MKRLLPLLLLTALPAYGAVTQVQTCLDTPQIVSPASYSACKNIGCGPTYNTDRVRTNDPANANNQVWESWATLASTRKVLQCVAGAVTNTWDIKANIQATPPAPPAGPPVSTVPTVATVTLTWTTPIQNTDNSPLTDLSGYNVYQGPSATGLVKVGNITVPATTYTTSSLASGTYYFALTAVNAAGTESAQSPVVSTVLAPAPPKVPGAPAGLKITVTVTAGP